jgi:16S rRNA (cytosine967-C5)-methyltransferase
MSGPRAPLLSGREAAYQAIRDVLSGQGFAHQTLGALRSQGRVGDADAAFAQELALGVVRHTRTIREVLARLTRFDPRRVSLELRCALYAGVYQLVWMDRVPAYAAVAQTVDLARGVAGRRSTGMANALLRRVAAAIVDRGVTWRRLAPDQVRTSWARACGFDRPVLPDPRERGLAEHLGAATGQGAARLRRLIERLGPEVAESVAWASSAVPVTVLHRNPLRTSPDAFRRRVREALGPDVEVDGRAAYVPPDVPFRAARLMQEGSAWVQDTTAREIAEVLAARPGERVLDLCAAPGGKSIAIAVAMQDRGAVVACERSAQRLETLRQNVDRLGLRSIRVQHLPKGGPTAAHQAIGAEPFDAVIVDVPCSNSGVVARRPEARLRLTPAALTSLRGVQAELIRLAADFVAPRGRLLYSTCSIEPEENEHTVTGFVQAAGDWRLAVSRLILPGWGPRPSDWRDGGFAALLTREDSGLRRVRGKPRGRDVAGGRRKPGK